MQSKTIVPYRNYRSLESMKSKKKSSKLKIKISKALYSLTFYSNGLWVCGCLPIFLLSSRESKIVLLTKAKFKVFFQIENTQSDAR